MKCFRWMHLFFGLPYERPAKPPTFWKSHIRTLILATIMKLSETIGVDTKNADF